MVAPSTGSVVLVPFPFSDLLQAARAHRWPDQATHPALSSTVPGPRWLQGSAARAPNQWPLDFGSALYIVLIKLCLPFR